MIFESTFLASRVVIYLAQLAESLDDSSLKSDLEDACFRFLIFWPLTIDKVSEVCKFCDRLSLMLQQTKTLYSDKVIEAKVHRGELLVLRLRLALTLLQKSTLKVSDKKLENKTNSEDKEIKAKRLILNQTQRKVLNWIEINPQARMRELIANFSASISPRSVKRVLKELLAQGLILRKTAQGVSSYTIIDSSK